MAKVYCNFACDGEDSEFTSGEYDFTCCLECDKRMVCDEACMEESSDTCGSKRVGKDAISYAKKLMKKKSSHK